MPRTPLVRQDGPGHIINANDGNEPDQYLAWLSRGVHTAAEHGAKGDGSTDDSSLLTNTDAAAGTTAVAVLGPTSTGYRLAQNTTLTAGWNIPPGAQFKPDAGKTLAINGPLRAGPYQIFGGAGTVVLASTAVAKPEWWGTGAAALHAAITALASGGILELLQGTYLHGTLTLPAEPKTLSIVGKGTGATILQANAANTPLFTTPGTGVWSKGRLEGFSTKAHASGSTGAAIPLFNARTVTIKDIEYLTNGSGDFAAWVALGGGLCYGITIDHPIMQGQVGPAKVISFVNAGTSASNCNIATIKNGWFYSNSGTGTIIDALRSANVGIVDTEFEANTNYTCIVPGTSTKTRGNWLEANATGIVPATVAGQGTTNGCELGPDYISTAATVTFPVGCTNNVLNNNWPDTNLTMVDSDGSNLQRIGSTLKTANVDGIYTLKNTAAGANLWQIIIEATGANFGGPGALVIRNATTAKRPITLQANASDLALSVTANGVQLDGGGHIRSGTGAPTLAGAVGDIYVRIDTPTVANQRIYICTATTPTWVGIL